jgi:hypothetical protein
LLDCQRRSQLSIVLKLVWFVTVRQQPIMESSHTGSGPFERLWARFEDDHQNASIPETFPRAVKNVRIESLRIHLEEVDVPDLPLLAVAVESVIGTICTVSCRELPEPFLSPGLRRTGSWQGECGSSCNSTVPLVGPTATQFSLTASRVLGLDSMFALEFCERSRRGPCEKPRPASSAVKSHKCAPMSMAIGSDDVVLLTQSSMRRRRAKETPL